MIKQDPWLLFGDAEWVSSLYLNRTMQAIHRLLTREITVRINELSTLKGLGKLHKTLEIGHILVFCDVVTK